MLDGRPAGAIRLDTFGHATRAEVGIPQGGWPSGNQHTYHIRCDSLQAAESYLEIKSMSRFARI